MSDPIDKRSVSTDALATLGTKITEKEGRDAIHLAVENVIAGQILAPGDPIGFLEDGSVGVCENPVGIVDPFIQGLIEPGERFWLIVFPRTITSLRHVWSHPSFPEERNTENKQKSEDWLREFCRKLDTSNSYNEIMENALNHVKTNASFARQYRTAKSLCFGEEIYGKIPNEFWDHFEIVFNVKVKNEIRAEYFSCAC